MVSGQVFGVGLNEFGVFLAVVEVLGSGVMDVGFGVGISLVGVFSIDVDHAWIFPILENILMIFHCCAVWILFKVIF